MSTSSSSGGLSDLFSNLNRLVTHLGDVVDEGGEIKRTVHFGDETGDGPSGVVGVHIRTNIGATDSSEAVSVHPFGNLREDDDGRIVVDETRDPVVDVYDEDNHVRIVAELPGATEDDVTIDVHDQTAVLDAKTERHHYRTTLHLPRSVNPASVSIHATNGIVNVTLDAAPSDSTDTE